MLTKRSNQPEITTEEKRRAEQSRGKVTPLDQEQEYTDRNCHLGIIMVRDQTQQKEQASAQETGL